MVRNALGDMRSHLQWNDAGLRRRRSPLRATLRWSGACGEVRHGAAIGDGRRNRDGVPHEGGHSAGPAGRGGSRRGRPNARRAVLDRLKADPLEQRTAQRYEDNPEALEPAPRAAIDATVADKAFATQLEQLVASFREAAGPRAVNIIGTVGSSVVIGEPGDWPGRAGRTPSPAARTTPEDRDRGDRDVARGPSPAEQAVVIRGNVSGSVVVGNDNIVVNGVNGSVFIGKIQPTRTAVRPPRLRRRRTRSWAGPLSWRR